ncbi:MAG: hypothetical protein PWP08_457 [Methanofollis sp.]|nr:hypothetical protein [Methanofollis sp.]
MQDMTKLLFGAVLGALYVVLGIFQILWTVIGPQPGFDALFLTGDPFNGFVLLVIGAVFVTGAWKLFRDIGEGAVFIYIGILLSILFGMVEFFALCAGAIETIFFGEEGSGWAITDSINPLLYLAAIGAVGFFAWGREFLRGLRAA